MSIDQIIERELIGGRAVSLPFVGTLVTRGLEARFTAGIGSPVVPPRSQLMLDASFDDRYSIINLAAYYLTNNDINAATELYNQWVAMASSTEQGVLHIYGVCRISTADFKLFIDERMEQLLAPAGVEPMSVGRIAPEPMPMPRPVRTSSNRQSTLTITLALLLVIAAALYMVYYLFFRN